MTKSDVVKKKKKKQPHLNCKILTEININQYILVTYQKGICYDQIGFIPGM